MVVYDERVTLIAEKIQEYIFVAPQFMFTGTTETGKQVKLTYCHQMTLAGEIICCLF